MNQPAAAIANHKMLIDSCAPVIRDKARLNNIVRRSAKIIRAFTDDVWREKMGFASEGSKDAARLWSELEPLMRRSQVDYTIFWRQLARMAELMLNPNVPSPQVVVELLNE